MNREIRFTIFEKPTPQRRHRHNKNGMTYDPDKNEKIFIRSLIKAETEKYASLKELLLQAPVSVDMRFYFPLPKSKSARKMKGLYHVSTVDIDNLQKKILDCLTGLIFIDDRIVFKITAVKLYTNTKARTEVVIKEVMQEPVLKENHEGSERSYMSSQSRGVSSQTHKCEKNIIPATVPGSPVPNDKNY